MGSKFALDAGCGSGGSLPHLASRFNVVVGLDPDLTALLIAAKRCLELGFSDRATLVAGTLEYQVFSDNTFDAIKCTDVIEHVVDPTRASKTMSAGLARDGALFLLTPNKWSPGSPEPHVRLWGVQFLPDALADAYVRKRLGVAYTDVARMLTYKELMNTLREASDGRVVFVPIEDKHLNPASPRGMALKRMFTRPPLRWLSNLARPFQPSFEVVCVKAGSD